MVAVDEVVDGLFVEDVVVAAVAVVVVVGGLELVGVAGEWAKCLFQEDRSSSQSPGSESLACPIRSRQSLC